jgi:ketol-acid reductoisomerase
MLKAVSDTAKYGGLSVGPKIIDSHVRANMLAAAEHVRDGSFAREWLDEDAQGRPNMTKQLEAWMNHPLELIGNKIRKLSGLKQ